MEEKQKKTTHEVEVQEQPNMVMPLSNSDFVTDIATNKFEDVILHILEVEGIEDFTEKEVRVASEILQLLRGLKIVDATLILKVCKVAMQYKVF